MNIIMKEFKHSEKGFTVKVVTCNKRIATTENIETGETIKFNRGKFEWMINKGIFNKIDRG